MLYAEQLAASGITSDHTHLLSTCSPCCRAVVLAAAPADARWRPSLCRFYPARFTAAARQLVLASSRPALERCRAAAPAGLEVLSAAACSCEDQENVSANSGCSSGSSSSRASVSMKATSQPVSLTPALPPQPFAVLPSDCVQRILALAAAPLSSWL